MFWLKILAAFFECYLWPIIPKSSPALPHSFSVLVIISMALTIPNPFSEDGAYEKAYEPLFKPK